MKSNVVDQPATADKDHLNMKAYADALTDFVKGAEAPLTIALQGEWGSGKTSLMNSLKASLVDDPGAPFLGVWINTWQYALLADPQDAILKILAGIVSQVSKVAETGAEERGRILKKVWAVSWSVVSQVVAKQTGVDGNKVKAEWGAGEADDGAPGVEALKNEIATLVAKSLAKEKGKSGFLFFIDDLDRIDPPVAVQILELLKNVFDLENCIFILAIDYGVVVKGLEPKFGTLNPKNEREFRSFFDKIIQLPFAMPVNSYTIDNFLKDSLIDIGYLDVKETKETGEGSLCEALTDYALQSVGRNPRSLKRLINYLSLIRLLIERTPSQEDDADFKSWKDILFALVCLQVQYPKVYEALLGDADFTAWGETFEQKWHLDTLKEGEKAKLDKMEEFDEPWEQMLFRFCRRDTFLEARALNISNILNRIKVRIIAANQPVGMTVAWLLRLSAVTNVKGGQEQSTIVEFNTSQYLKDLRSRALGMADIWNDDGAHGWETTLPNGPYLSCWQGAVKTQLILNIWVGCSTWSDSEGDFISEPHCKITHDGKSFLLSLTGTFFGNSPEAEKDTCIDFEAKDIQADLAAAEAAYCAAWEPFGIHAVVGNNIGHWPENIWWNVTLPFKDHDELVSPAFSQKLRTSLDAVANAFASLLPYRKETQA
jgi:hypothetical protein